MVNWKGFLESYFRSSCASLVFAHFFAFYALMWGVRKEVHSFFLTLYFIIKVNEWRKKRKQFSILESDVPYLVSKRKSYLSRQYFIPFQLMEVLADTAPSHCLANWPFLGPGSAVRHWPQSVYLYLYLEAAHQPGPDCCTQSVRRVPCGWWPWWSATPL